MKKRDIISSLLWIAVGSGLCYSGYDLDIGEISNPGSGFMLFWLGVIVIGLSLLILIPALKTKATEGELASLWKGIRWQKVIIILAALFIYAYAFKPLGFILSTALLLLFLFKAIEPQKWSWAVFGAVVSTLAAYGLFNWLGCQLPQGILGV